MNRDMMMGCTMAITMAAIAGIGAGAQTARAGVGPVVDVETVCPIPEMPVPPLQEWVTDPTFGSRIKRISEVFDTESGAVVPMYSKTQPWNADGSLMIIYKQGGAHQLMDGRKHTFIRTLSWKYDGNTYKPVSIENLWWHPTDPDILIYPSVDNVTETPRMVRYHVSSGKVETIGEFPEYTKDWNFGAMGEGNMSNDGRWVALRGRRQSDKVREYFVYDMQAKGFRCVNLTTVKRIKCGELNKEWYV